MTVPAPRSQPGVGHLGRWGTDPLALLEEGASLAPVFELRLWRRALVGSSPDWNRFVLGDLATFHSRGSLSGLSPYLGAGVVQLDAPGHRSRRRHLNPSFARPSVESLTDRIVETVHANLPTGRFDATAWSSLLLQRILSATFFDDQVDPDLLAAFLRPLDLPLPGPFVPRPVLFRRMDRAVRRRLVAARPGALAAAFRGLPDGVAEMRVAISAAYDTTAHTLAWLLAHTAQRPELRAPESRRQVIDEVLRLYPAGWLGSRRATVDTSFHGVPVPRGTLVLYSPYLTHRDPALWPDPLTFDPRRFARHVPAWGFIPFAAGERTCLGRVLARTVLEATLTALGEDSLAFVGGDLRPQAGLTLRPTGPVTLLRAPAAARECA